MDKPDGVRNLSASRGEAMDKLDVVKDLSASLGEAMDKPDGVRNLSASRGEAMDKSDGVKDLSASRGEAMYRQKVRAEQKRPEVQNERGEQGQILPEGRGAHEGIEMHKEHKEQMDNDVNKVQKDENTSDQKSLLDVFKGMLLVLKDWKFLLMVLLYSVFWILYFQMYGTVLWYVDEYMDMGPVNNAVNKFLGLFVDNPSWFFDVEHVTVVNAGVIILLQLFVSKIVQKAPALPTMIVGIGFGTLGMAILSFSNSPWLFIIGITTFTLGEMTAHPKYNSYIGMIAPADKKALYMGYSFLYGVIGSSIGGFVGASLYVKYVETLGKPSAFFLIFACLGAFSMIALWLYNRFIAPRRNGQAA